MFKELDELQKLDKGKLISEIISLRLEIAEIKSNTCKKCGATGHHYCIGTRRDTAGSSLPNLTFTSNE
jgi:hypothetical protein